MWTTSSPTGGPGGGAEGEGVCVKLAGVELARARTAARRAALVADAAVLLVHQIELEGGVVVVRQRRVVRVVLQRVVAKALARDVEHERPVDVVLAGDRLHPHREVGVGEVDLPPLLREARHALVVDVLVAEVPARGRDGAGVREVRRELRWIVGGRRTGRRSGRRVCRGTSPGGCFRSHPFRATCSSRSGRGRRSCSSRRTR